MEEMFVTEEVIRGMSSVASELAIRAVRACGSKYGFDADEAIRELGLTSVKISTVTASSRSKSIRQVTSKVVRQESSIRMPYSGECNDDGCHGLRHNAGLYTQCKLSAKVEKLCKTCQNSADRNDGTPEYGTIDMRKEQDMLGYVDPKGRKQVAFSKVMTKFGYSKEQVLEEAGKQGITIEERHFEEVEVDVVSKKSEKPAKVVNEPSSGKKGRPKKAETVVEIDEGAEEVTDLFAALVMETTTEVSKENTKKSKKAKMVVDEEEVADDEEDEEANAARALVEKKLKKKAKEEAKKAAEEKARLEEEAKKAAAEEEAKKAAASDDEEEEEEERVTKIKENGVNYLRSSISGAIYDYKAYTEREEQVVLGRWDEATNKIIFKKAEESEEEEEEYEEESEEEEEE